MTLDDATVEAMQSLLNETRTENGMVIDVEDPIINLLLEALANRAQYLNEVGLEYLISRLKQLYVERLPDKGLSTNDFTDELLQKLMDTASKGDLQTVKNELLNIINSITSFEFLVVSELPSKGQKGVIYLLRLTKFNTVKNLYEEYIWVNDRYELLGMFDTDQTGPFVTADDFANSLKNYIQKIEINGTQVGPGTNGVADISDAILAFIKSSIGTIGSVNKISLNGSTYSPTSGTVSLPTLAHTATVNGSTYTASSTGNIALPTLLHQLKINGSTKTVSSSGVIDLGDLATSDDIPDGGLTSVSVSVNGGSYETNANGVITLPTLAHQVKVNGSTYTASSAGLVTLMTLAHQVKINGSTYTASASGLVDLGTIESGGGGGTVHTGTSNPASSLGSNDDFYYKFPS